MKLRVIYLGLAVLSAACGSAARPDVTINTNTPAGTPSANVVAAATPVTANAAPVASPSPSSAQPVSTSPAPRPSALGTPGKASVANEKDGPRPAGIPSAEEIKRFMTQPSKVDPNAPTQQQPMMKSNRPLGGRMSANSNKP
jgi:hypothetical protein